MIIHFNNILLSIILIIFFSCNRLPHGNDIHGTWKGIYSDKEISFVFNSDETCTLTFWDISSESFKTIDGEFELDLSKNPIPLSIRNIPQLNHPLHTIIEFIHKDSIRIGNFAPRWRVRPVSFQGDKTLYLKRVIEN